MRCVIVVRRRWFRLLRRNVRINLRENEDLSFVEEREKEKERERAKKEKEKKISRRRRSHFQVEFLTSLRNAS